MIEIIIIGGYFTYPPEGKTFDTRLIGERIQVPEDSSLAAIRARATRIVKNHDDMSAFLRKHLSKFRTDTLDTKPHLSPTEQKAFIWKNIGSRDDGWQEAWHTPDDSETVPGMRITTRYCDVYRRRWTSVSAYSYGSDSRKKLEAEIAARNEYKAYYGIFYPAGKITEG